jgi:hypothetical protein
VKLASAHMKILDYNYFMYILCHFLANLIWFVHMNLSTVLSPTGPVIRSINFNHWNTSLLVSSHAYILVGPSLCFWDKNGLLDDAGSNRTEI